MFSVGDRGCCGFATFSEGALVLFAFLPQSEGRNLEQRALGWVTGIDKGFADLQLRQLVPAVGETVIGRLPHRPGPR